MGGGKSSGSQTTTVQMTPEQRDILATQSAALKNTFLPAYQNTIAGASQAYNQANPAATQAAQTALDVSGRAGALQEAGGTQAYQSGLGGSQALAGYQTGLGQGLVGQGAGGLGQSAGQMTAAGNALLGRGAGGAQDIAGYQSSLSRDLTGQGAGGVGNLAGLQTGLGSNLTGQGATGTESLAGYQAGLGSNLTGQASSQLSQLFSPQYKQQQIQAAMQPATEDIRDQMSQQAALFGGAGGLGSSRQALASRNLASLGQARLGNIAAQTSAGVESQRQQAANTLLGAGQTASGQAGSLYGQLLGAGQGAIGQAGSLYGQLLGAGQGAAGQAGSLYSGLAGQGAGLMGQGSGAYQALLGAGQQALGAGQQGYGNLANLGQAGLTGAQQSAASRIGYAQTPQDIYSKYASVIYGVPQASTTPNFQGTQGGTTSGSSKGFGFTRG